MNNVAESALSIEKNPNCVSPDARASLLENPAFGRVFTDHMATIRYTEGKGWHDAKIGARGPIPCDPSTLVLHYADHVASITFSFQRRIHGCVEDDEGAGRRLSRAGTPAAGIHRRRP